MPFRSEKQRRFLHARHPEIAERWEHETHGKMQMAAGGFSREEAARIAKLVDLDFAREDFTLADFTEGLNVELEHADVTKKRAVATAKIALAHLRERGDYYRRLREVEAHGKMRACPTPTEVKAAMAYEREHGKGDERERAGKIANHLQERPDYYVDLERRLTVPMFAKGGGPFIGPKGGKWADAAHTIPWHEAGEHASHFLAATTPQAQAQAYARWVREDYAGYIAAAHNSRPMPKGTRERVRAGAETLTQAVADPAHPDHEDAKSYLAEQQATVRAAPERAKRAAAQAKEDRAQARYEAQGLEIDPSNPPPLSKLRGKKVWLYHGTTTKLIDQIKKHGIQSSGKHGKRSNVGSSGFVPASDRVFLTARTSGPASAEFYANNAARKHGGDAVIVRVLVNGDALSRDRDDSDLSAGGYQYEIDGVSPDEIMEVGGKRHRGGKLSKGGPYIGPKGGLWADAAHTIHWDPSEHGRGASLPEAERHVKIKRIVGIRDTRERELVEGRLGVEYSRPIPGSGVSAVCARCGREHEVHAAVELTNGRHAIMGTGCARQQDPEQASRISTLERAAKALGKASHELAQKRAQLAAVTAKNDRGRAIVDKLTVPDLVDVDPSTVTEEWARQAIEQRGLRRVAIGDVQGWQHPASEMTSETYRRNEARKDVALAWRQKRLAEQGVDERAAHDLRGEVEHLEKRVKKLSAQREVAVREGLTKAQLYTGPKGGRWADPQHTIPYHEGAPEQPSGGAPKPPAPGGAQPQQAAPPSKPLPAADVVGQQGAQVVAAIRQHDPQLASQLEESLQHIVVGLRARQAGAKTPEGDAKIVGNLKAFARAFNSAAAPSSILGPDLGSLLEAAEKKNKREAADQEAEASDALAAGRAGLSQVTVAARGLTVPERQAAPEQPVPEATGLEQAPAQPQGPEGLAGDYQIPPQGHEDGVLDVFGMGSPDEVNRQFGYDPRAQQLTEAAQGVLGRLDEADRPETERALAEVHAGQGQQEQSARRAEQDRAARAGYDQDLAQAKERRDATERAASDAAERWAARQKGRRGSAVLRQQLGAPEQPEKVEISPERAAARTQAPKRKPKAEAPLERAITPTRLLKSAIGGQPQPMPSIGPTQGAAPGQYATIPDYQAIYFQPPDADRKRREEEAEANRRQADADVSQRAHGFHGTGDVRLDPTLLYVPAVRTMAAVGGQQIAQRAPLVVADHVRPRLKAGGPGMPADPSVPRSPGTRAGALSPQAPAAASRPVPLDGVTPSGTPGAVQPPMPVIPVQVPPEEPDEEEDNDEEEDVDETTEKGQRALAVLYEALEKAGAGVAGHKYIRRVPTGDPKRPWRYYYAESAIARDVQAGEEVSLGHGQGIAKVHAVDKDGTVHVELGGRTRAVKPEEWANLLVRGYGTRYHAWAEKRAEASVNAVLRHVPRGMLEDLEGSDEERLAQLQKRVPAVYAKLQQAFGRAGVNPFRAKGILAAALERRGWSPEARAAAVGSVLTKRTSATRFSEIVRGAESLAAGAQVTVGHVGTVVELRGGANEETDDFADRVAEIAKRAEAELAKLSEALAKARGGSNNDRANALATALASSAIAKLNLLTTAFPGLKDRVADEARAVMTASAAAAPHPTPKTDGGETAVYVAGDGGQPRAIRAKYKLVNASEVVASHDPLKGFKKREDYPEGVQERAYHRDESEQGKVMRNAQILNPAFVANTNPDAVNGPPVVIEQNGKLIALGGNSRTMSMQRAYAHHEEKGAALKAYLAEHAHEFGLRPEDVEAVDQPVLVRVIEPEDTSLASQKLLVRQLNESFTQGMDPRTMQVAMGRKLDEQSLASLGADMKEDETLASFLASTRSERFVNALQRAGIIDQRNANQYLKKGTKLLNEDGRTLVERILVGRVVGDADILSNTGPKIVGNIAAAVPYMVQAKASGGKGYDVGADLAVALSAYNDLHHRVESGALPALDPKMDAKTFDRLFNYFDSLFGDRHPVVDNKNARALLELLIRKPGPQQQAAVWRDYVRRAGQNPEGQGSMFGPAKTPGEVLRETVTAALNRSDDKANPSQRGLF